MEWALAKGKHRVSTYAKEEVQRQNTSPAITAGVSDFTGERRGGITGPGVLGCHFGQQQGTCEPFGQFLLENNSH